MIFRKEGFSTSDNESNDILIVLLCYFIMDL